LCLLDSNQMQKRSGIVFDCERVVDVEVSSSLWSASSNLSDCPNSVASRNIGTNVSPGAELS